MTAGKQSLTGTRHTHPYAEGRDSLSCTHQCCSTHGVKGLLRQNHIPSQKPPLICFQQRASTTCKCRPTYNEGDQVDEDSTSSSPLYPVRPPQSTAQGSH